MFDILFKQLGLNPADLKKQISDAGEMIKHFDSRLATLEDKIDKLISRFNN